MMVIHERHTSLCGTNILDKSLFLFNYNRGLDCRMAAVYFLKRTQGKQMKKSSPPLAIFSFYRCVFDFEAGLLCSVCAQTAAATITVKILESGRHRFNP